MGQFDRPKNETDHVCDPVIQGPIPDHQHLLCQVVIRDFCRCYHLTCSSLERNIPPEISILVSQRMHVDYVCYHRTPLNSAPLRTCNASSSSFTVASHTLASSNRFSNIWISSNTRMRSTAAGPPRSRRSRGWVCLQRLQLSPGRAGNRNKRPSARTVYTRGSGRSYEQPSTENEINACRRNRNERDTE